ncbi:uncharacterized protein AMSG_00929 [Thecamonas trahens ATCC 50062]|uniref:F-BAR domain-containing protein n=1 Tax=Thecamonas trahens ATCC 50062 TaxID=461836 RepID=A0A0L0DJ61_THETB|nr:hypothetical protein AMSG_00929 [Thecamonas trahens ATCC 50062]KNC52101.1 hypothetical protein AMSG_00929 [Thecamonas trahens ATCC 50062]|eukprot:XP_013762106.1 hypothetical protein AMSG_00929 [Thecamonas trahens ATCC 50062]
MAVNFANDLLDQFQPLAAHAEAVHELTSRAAAFLRKRAAIEEEYARKLLKLAEAESKKIADSVLGVPLKTVKVFDVMVQDTRRQAVQAESLAGRLVSQVAKPLSNLKKKLKASRVVVVADTAAERKRTEDIGSQMMKERDRYHEACRLAFTDMSTYRKSASDPNIKPSASMKQGDRMKKSKDAARKQEMEYRDALARFNDVQRRFWVDTLPFALEQMQLLEEERINETDSIYDKYLDLVAEARDSLTVHHEAVAAVHTPNPPPAHSELEDIACRLATGNSRPSDIEFCEGVNYQDRDPSAAASPSRLRGATVSSSSEPGSGGSAAAAAAAAGAVVVGGGLAVAVAAGGTQTRSTRALTATGVSSAPQGSARNTPRSLTLDQYIASCRDDLGSDELARRSGDISTKLALFAMLHELWRPS